MESCIRCTNKATDTLDPVCFRNIDFPRKWCREVLFGGSFSRAFHTSHESVCSWCLIPEIRTLALLEMLSGLAVALMCLSIAAGQQDDGLHFLPGTSFEAEGDLSRTFSVGKHSPEVCYLRLNFDDLGYLDCGSEYLSIGGERICGPLSNDYEFPFAGDNLTVTYRGRFPLKVRSEQIECEPSELRSCGVTTRETEVSVRSPNYPNRYPTLTHCQYTIVPGGEGVCRVSIVFDDFDVEASPNCRKDRLLVGGERLCGNLRNYRTNGNFSNNLTIRFISDSSTGGRGFSARIRQIRCGNTSLRYQDNFPRESVDSCCDREYRDPYMIITSPGFLGSEPVESNCRYTVRQTHPSACRLRFTFKHFWVGEEDVRYGCVNGFLEIDGIRFCGCLDGYRYASHFDEGGRKDLRLTYRGTGQRGFVIEIQQEECDSDRYPFDSGVDPKTEIEVFTTNATSEKALGRFLIPREASRCYSWGLPGWHRQVQSFLADSQVPTFCSSPFQQKGRDSRDAFERNPNSRFYPFLEEDSSSAPFYPPGGFPGHAPPSFPPGYPRSPPIWSPPPHSRCEILSGFAGEFRSPFYPSPYPPNTRKCYAFQRIPDYCRVEVRFLTFDLESSIKCWKDYLLVDGERRFCGKSLAGSNVVLNFGNGALAFLHFVSDRYFSGRGFLARYRQIHCLAPFGSLPRSIIETPPHTQAP